MRRRATAACFAALLAASAAAEPFQDQLLREHLWREVQALPRSERPTVGLALSAGAVRGLAHIGVLQVLEDAGFPIDVVAGTSMGALVGAMYAAGLPMPRLWDFGQGLLLSSGSNLNSVSLLRLILFDTLLSAQNIEKAVKKIAGGKRFDELVKPFACVAMDIKTGEAIIFREGPLAPAVRASANLPGIFAPVEYRHRYLVDGGVVNYIPIDAARLLGAEWVLASVTEGDYTRTLPTNIMATLDQVIDIRGAILSREQRKHADMLIEPPVGDILFHETERRDEAMEKGVAEAKRRLPTAQERLILFSVPRLMRRWKGR